MWETGTAIWHQAPAASNKHTQLYPASAAALEVYPYPQWLYLFDPSKLFRYHSSSFLSLLNPALVFEFSLSVFCATAFYKLELTKCYPKKGT